eukprot:3204984-Pyramimonas_sp.AAC.1
MRRHHLLRAAPSLTTSPGKSIGSRSCCSPMLHGPSSSTTLAIIRLGSDPEGTFESARVPPPPPPSDGFKARSLNLAPL